jgi:hypothetical protein
VPGIWTNASAGDYRGLIVKCQVSDDFSLPLIAEIDRQRL